MSDVKLADLNDIRDFFDRVGTICKNASSTGEFYTNPIGVKDFIEWCNDPCKNISENSSHSDQAYKLAETVHELNKLNENKLNENKLEEMESALKEDRWDEWCEDNSIKASADDAVFYLVLKYRTDDQRHYHFYFDKDAVAELDAFDPFTKDENGKEVLDQQWHVLISLLAYLDVAHALGNEQHKYHCLYRYINDLDKIDLNAAELQFYCVISVKPEYCGISIKPELRLNTKEGKRVRKYPSGRMNEWLNRSLR